MLKENDFLIFDFIMKNSREKQFPYRQQKKNQLEICMFK